MGFTIGEDFVADGAVQHLAHVRLVAEQEAPANDQTWWDNSAAAYLGWKPKDNAERFRPEIEAALARPAPDAPIAVYQGGQFTQDPIFKDL